jgi:hypothetical protein
MRVKIYLFAFFQFLISIQVFAQEIDSLFLYAGGPNYVLKKAFTTEDTLDPCDVYQTDQYYEGAVGIALYHSNKYAVGDTTVLGHTPSGFNYIVTSTLPIRKSAIAGLDTILPQQPSSGEVNIVEQYRGYHLFVVVTSAQQTGPAKEWTKIYCTPPSPGWDSTKLKYRITIENKPQVLTKAFSFCSGSPILNLSSNVDKKGGSFYIAKSGLPFSSASKLSTSYFDPSQYSVGTYTIFYKKAYANDTANLTVVSFTINLSVYAVNISASPSSILQGDHVSFQATATLNAGDVIMSEEWDLGDKTPLSQITNPVHYYIDTGFTDVSVKIKTKLGCVISFTKKAAVYVKSVKIPVTTEAQGPVPYTDAPNTSNDLRIYPNPVKDILFFKAFVPLHQVTFSLHRMEDGQRIFEKFYPFVSQVQIAMDTYPAGPYLLQMNTEDGQLNYFKLIKE